MKTNLFSQTGRWFSRQSNAAPILQILLLVATSPVLWADPVDALLPPPAVERWTPPWPKWAADKSLKLMQLHLTAKAQTNAPFSVSIGSVTATNTGIGCDASTEPMLVEVPVKLYRPFSITLRGSNVQEAILTFKVPNLTDLVVSKRVKGRPATPMRFKAFVDGEEAYQAEYSTNSCSPCEQTWIIEIRPDKDALLQNFARSSDSGDVPDCEAPGDASWPEIGPGNSRSPGIAPVKWNVGLGRLLNGKSAGRLSYAEYGLSSNSYTPNALFLYQPFTNHTQVVVLTNTAITNAAVLRQIRTPQAFLDIPANTTNGFELRFYLLSQVTTNTNATTGYYDILTNTPYVTWKVVNPDQDPTTTRRLRITEERPGLGWTNDIAFDPTNNIWSIIRGTGDEQYRETRSIAIEARDEVYFDEWLFEDVTNRVYFRYETNQVADGLGNTAYLAVETYQTITNLPPDRKFSTNWVLQSVVTDPSYAALTTTFDYWQPSGANDPAAGALRSITYPDGSWEKRSYMTIWYIDNCPLLLQSIRKPLNDTTLEEAETNVNCVEYSYEYRDEWGLGLVVPYGCNRTSASDGYLNQHYRYDTTKKDFLWSTLQSRDTYQMGGVPNCNGAKVRDGAVRYWDTADAAACGYEAMSLTNYVIGVTNTYAFGLWSSPTFSPDTNYCDWRRTSIHGNGTLEDQDDLGSVDGLQTVSGKSSQRTEIRQGGVVVCQELQLYADSFDNGTNFSLIHRDFRTNDVLGHAIGIARVDAATSAARTLRTADWQGTNQASGPLLWSETDEDGSVIRYTYDSLKRVKTKTVVGATGLPDHATTFAYDACGRLVAVATNAGSLSLAIECHYDLSGRPSWTADAAGLVTSYSYPDGGRSTVTISPGGATRTNTHWLSGEPKSETGTATVEKHYDYEYYDIGEEQSVLGQKPIPALLRTSLVGSPGSSRLSKTYFNLWDSPIQQVTQGPSGEVTNTFVYSDPNENPSRREAPGLDPTLPIKTQFAYDTENHVFESKLDVYADGGLSPAPNRRTRIEAVYTNLNGAWFRATNTYAYRTDDGDTPALVSSERHRLSGFGANFKAETIFMDAHSNTVTVTVYVDRSNKKVTEVASSTTSTLPATNIIINGLLQSQSSFTVAAPTIFVYDALRRPVTTASPAGAASTVAYETGTGRMKTTTDFAGNVTTYDYYPSNHLNAGRVKCVTAPNGRKTRYEYTARGELYRTWGDVPYPEERSYNSFGELVELHTFRDGSGWSGVTWPADPGNFDRAGYWVYHAASGLLLRKEDAYDNPVTYTYHTNTWLHTRTWVRGVVTTNLYNTFGDQYRVDYSDGTPSVTYTNWNRAGQPRTVIDDSGSHSLTYDYAGRLLSDSCSDGMQAGMAVQHHYNPAHGRDYLEVQGPSGAYALRTDFGFDTFGRLGSVAANGNSASYAYWPNTDRLQTTTHYTGGTPVLTTRRTWDYGERLQSIANEVNGYPISSFRYLYDAVQRRTQAVLEDGSSWNYGYNGRNELTSAKRRWEDFAPVSGQQFQFAFDNMGNRTNAASGGDANGANLRVTQYSANAVNQYTSVTTPGYEDILGAAIATTNVTVDGGACDRKGEYFHREIAVTNTSAPVWRGVTVSCGGSSSNGGFVFPKNSQTLTYDYDGNLTGDGIWTYVWDAENRLKEMSMTAVSGITNAQRKKLQFTYDAQGRRVQKVVSTWNGSAFASPATNKFVYDGRNLLAVLTHDLGLLTSFTWGQDLSGTMDRAGGIGGLLCVTDHQAGVAHFTGFDGNGNITALVRTDGSVSARYEYSPFGEPLRVTGPAASVNPFQWSTKFADGESGLVYYGYRYYSPLMGRWISRDPIGEEGGRNLYGFVGNCPNGGVDADGRFLTLLEMLPEGEFNVAMDLMNANFYRGVASRFVADIAAFSDISQIVMQAGINAGTTASSYASAYVGTQVLLSRTASFVYEAAWAVTGFVTPGAPNPGDRGSSQLGSLLGNDQTQQSIKQAVYDAVEAFIFDEN